MRKYTLLLLLLISGAAMAQTNDFLVGEGNVNQLKQEPFKKWFDKGYRYYKPDEKTIDKLKEANWDGVGIVIIMGTWCDDSHEQIPRLAKVLDELELTTTQARFFFVDDEKQEPNDVVAKYKLKYVPTIVLERDGAEIDRIVETPEKSMEKDLLKLVKKG